MSKYYVKTKSGSILTEEWYEDIPEIFRSTFGGIRGNKYVLSNGYPFGESLLKLESSKSFEPNASWEKSWMSYPGFIYDKENNKAFYYGRPVALATIHGSKLYGTSHAGSDDDRYIVIDDLSNTDSVKSKQSMKDGNDVLILGLKQYLDILSRGAHQSLEAKFSPYAFIDDNVKSMIRSLEPGKQSMDHKYLSASKSFFLAGVETSSDKKVAHSFRLLKDYSDFMKYGRIFPTKTSEQINLLSGLRDNVLANIETL